MPGRYKPYADYKDSGVGWIGKLPIHWMVMPVKRIAKIVNGSTPKSGEPSFWDGEIIWITPSDFGKLNSPYISVGARSITQAGYDSCGSTIVPVETIVLSSRAPIGSLAITAKELCTNQGCKSLVVSKEYYFKYLYYVLLSSTDQLNMLGRGTTFVELSSDELGFYKIAIPCKKDQSQIANFLDYETGKIDALIEKQQQLIKLLQEKRQAVISQAVTKGLNPAAPMKDSGVEWLGQVPAHWKVCLIKYMCSNITDGAHVSPVTEGGVFHFISIKDIKAGLIDFEGSLLTTPESFKYMLNTGCKPFPGDILFSKDGTIGETAIAPDHKEFVVASSLIIIRPKNDAVNPKFMNFLLQSETVKEQVESFVKGAALRRISIQNLLKIWGVFPQINEQLNIVVFLEKKLERYRDLELKTLKLISLLHERRRALISAAVTGKIDVRDWRAPAGSTAYSSQKYRNTGCEDEMELPDNGEEAAND